LSPAASTPEARRDANPTRHHSKEFLDMRYVNALALLLVIVGAVNWLLVGVAKFDLVAAITGTSFGQTNALSSVVYILVGVAGVILLPVLARWATASEANVRT
jgi:uncharacterized membrane protein YuzA (DUF378 family)